MQGWESECAGVVRIPLVANKTKHQKFEFIEWNNYKLSNSCFLKDVEPLFTISRICTTYLRDVLALVVAENSKLSNSKLLRFHQ